MKLVLKKNDAKYSKFGVGINNFGLYCTSLRLSGRWVVGEWSFLFLGTRVGQRICSRVWNSFQLYVGTVTLREILLVT